ncbi:MAG: hypothetical protein SVW57_07385 [Thermodesulfobacteriota bacterium]|nr:hypothetical protein [Thermodesulfobacteriota bacterium]
MVEEIKKYFRSIDQGEDIFKKAQFIADSGFHTENNMKMLCENEIDGYVTDNQFRKCDLRFAAYRRFGYLFIFLGRSEKGKATSTERMKQKIDSTSGQLLPYACSYRRVPLLISVQ